jgi:predicted Zn-dependent protease
MVLLAGRAGYDMARPRRSANGRLAIDELGSRYPAEPNVHYARGTYLVADDPAAAIEEFRRELAVSPDQHVAMIQIALAEEKRGHADVALPFAEKAVSLAPNMPAAHIALGRALLALGQVERAVQEMEAATRLAPEIPRLHYSLAEAYDRAGRKEDAARERSEFVKLRATSGEPIDAAIEGVPSAPAAGRSTE